ncbi:unnamed protein product [Mytilus edulis]|uniref:Uncharacterized protein n=1 Tax=Mytilus edulis TaxID=6550 RepID=A0A8S3T6E3_MYTED|nr:unnamed protein product [Mytilus edulis]
MFEFSFESAYITDIQIYYRANLAERMDGFKLYVTNTSTIPPVGFLCYEDGPGLPDITQTIPCNQLGKYVIYYDDKGDDTYGPIVELCYVAINESSGGPPANLANDGTVTTCSKTKGSSVTFHVDLQEKSIVTGLFILLGGQSLLILEHDKLLYT